jgi:hypothetical protein
VQIRFFLSVLHHMAQSDPMAALLTNPPQVEQRLSSLAPDRNKLKQNRISAPGTLIPHERWQGQLDQVAERGASPDRRSPTPETRPKSQYDHVQYSPRPLIPTSMTNTPLVPSFTDPKLDQFANLSIGRRRNVSGHYDDDGQFIESGQQPGRASPQWPRSPALEYGLGIGDPTLMGHHTAASFTHGGFGGLGRQKPSSPVPDRPAGGVTGGGAGGGAGVAGPDDVDPRILADVTNWLRVLRLHVRPRVTQ